MATATTVKLGELKGIERVSWQHKGSPRVRRIPGDVSWGPSSVYKLTNAQRLADITRRFSAVELQWDDAYECWRNSRPVGTLLVVMVYGPRP